MVTAGAALLFVLFISVDFFFFFRYNRPVHVKVRRHIIHKMCALRILMGSKTFGPIIIE